MKFVTGYAVEIDLREQTGGDLQIVLPRDSIIVTPEDRDGLADIMRIGTDLRANVSRFHAAMGIKNPERPCIPSDDVVRLRARMLIEELFETLRAMFAEAQIGELEYCERRLAGAIECADIRVSLSDYADGLADLMYIAEGGFLAFGIDSRPVHAEVQRANMAKVGGPVREDGKHLKPPGWQPPDIAGVIDRQRARIGDCAFCGRKETAVRRIFALPLQTALVCVDPVRRPDKPTPPNCAWRYCARATDGAHNPDESGTCKDCGKPAVAPK